MGFRDTRRRYQSGTPLLPPRLEFTNELSDDVEAPRRGRRVDRSRQRRLDEVAPRAIRNWDALAGLARGIAHRFRTRRLGRTRFRGIGGLA